MSSKLYTTEVVISRTAQGSMFRSRVVLIARNCAVFRASDVTILKHASPHGQRQVPLNADTFQAFTRTFTTTAPTSTSTTNGPTTVSFDLVGKNGTTTRIHVQPSYPHKPKAVENLLKQLPALLTAASMPVSTIKSFTTDGWDLDEGNDTIHRYLLLQNESDVDSIITAIEAASRDLNHDPHIHVDGSRLTISCTTHVPPGLSMKDVKLAKRIDEILADIVVYPGHEEKEADILTQRQRGREHNMEAVRKAKLECGCG